MVELRSRENGREEEEEGREVGGEKVVRPSIINLKRLIVIQINKKR